MEQNKNIGQGQSGNVGNLPPEIRRTFENVDFPVSKTELVDQIGTRTVSVGGKTLNFRDMLGKVQKERFQTQDELITEIQKLPELRSVGGTTGTMGGSTTGTGSTGSQPRRT